MSDRIPLVIMAVLLLISLWQVRHMREEIGILHMLSGTSKVVRP
jgi:hypothetical protein